jgi:hypothetical protein
MGIPSYNLVHVHRVPERKQVRAEARRPTSLSPSPSFNHHHLSSPAQDTLPPAYTGGGTVAWCSCLSPSHGCNEGPDGRTPQTQTIKNRCGHDDRRALLSLQVKKRHNALFSRPVEALEAQVNVGLVLSDSLYRVCHPALHTACHLVTQCILLGV